MKRRGVVLILLLFTGCSPQPVSQPVLEVGDLLGGSVAEGFLRAQEPRSFHFPEDHNPHPGYRSEWWYLTGNLRSDAGRPFGFQVTFFRFAIKPPAKHQRLSRWAADHFWMAHLAVTDPASGRHLAEQRLAREALGLAGGRSEPFALWVHNWTLTGEGTGFPWRAELEGEEVGLQLSFEPLRPPLLQGEEGLSRKGPEVGNASYYYSITRLRTRGQLRVGEKIFSVSGLAWLDREWGTSALGPDLAGWDWFALQLDDGSDLMYYRLRRKDGSSDAYSAGTLLSPGGGKRVLGAGDVELRPLRWWKNGEGGRYPVAWLMEVKPLQRTLRIEAVLDAQEMAFGIRYWEGAVEVSSGGSVIGRGYLEMTGYQ